MARARSAVSWRRRDGAATRGAVLRLAPARAPDAGLYECTASAPGGRLAQRDIELQVLSECATRRDPAPPSARRVAR